MDGAARADPAYRGDYGGDTWRRDSGYHQGPAWTWLIGAWIEAHLRIHGNVGAALGVLQGNQPTVALALRLRARQHPFAILLLHDGALRTEVGIVHVEIRQPLGLRPQQAFEVVAFRYFRNTERGHIIRAHIFQHATVAPHRGSHCIYDDCFPHYILQSMNCFVIRFQADCRQTEAGS